MTHDVDAHVGLLQYEQHIAVLAQDPRWCETSRREPASTDASQCGVDSVAYLEDMLDRVLLLEVERDHHNLPIIAHDLQHHAASHSVWLVKMTVQLGVISDTVTVYLEVPRVVLIASVWHNHLRTHPTEVVHSRPSEKSGGTEDGSLRRIAEQKGSKSNEGVGRLGESRVETGVAFSSPECH